MNKTIPMLLLFVGLTVSSGWIGKPDTSQMDGKTALAATSTIATQPVEEAKPPTNIKKEFDFNNVNGISLNDNVKTVIDKLGQPLSNEKDPFTPEVVVYEYPEMNIGFSDGRVSYVEVPVAAGKAKIDGVPIAIDQADLTNALGEPDFVAEDGIVFKRHVALIKLFTDMDTHEVTSLHYYHHSNI